MKQKSIYGLLVLLILALALVACGSEEPTEVPAEEPMEEPETGGLPDLGGREVTIAIENQYLPFNYINAQTGEEAGWDYEAWDEICRLLNCVPVFVEAGWEGMIQAVADGQYDAGADIEWMAPVYTANAPGSEYLYAGHFGHDHGAGNCGCSILLTSQG